MLYEDYEKKLTDVVTDPDNAPIAVQEILADIKTDLDASKEAIDTKDAEIEELKSTIEARDEQIKSLQDKNTKLFLQVTSSSDEPAEDTVEQEEITIEDLFEKKED